MTAAQAKREIVIFIFSNFFFLDFHCQFFLYFSLSLSLVYFSTIEVFVFLNTSLLSSLSCCRATCFDQRQFRCDRRHPFLPTLMRPSSFHWWLCIRVEHSSTTATINQHIHRKLIEFFLYTRAVRITWRFLTDPFVV